ncbi:MAG TPA: hypothetical protein VF400_02920 [Anaeromyxobacteraceae bacterium]
MRRIWQPMALLGLALAVGGCDSQLHALPCPGQAVGTFKFHGVLDGGCPFSPSSSASPASLDFTATIASTDPGEVHLCLDSAEAAPLTGSITGDHVTVTSPTPAPAGAQTIPDCACAVTVSETLEGDLVRADGGVTGFAGELRDSVAPGTGVNAASCERTPAAPSCSVPCVQTWSLGTTR